VRIFNPPKYLFQSDTQGCIQVFLPTRTGIHTRDYGRRFFSILTHTENLVRVTCLDSTIYHRTKRLVILVVTEVVEPYLTPTSKLNDLDLSFDRRDP
jgi:hypothetical protein